MRLIAARFIYRVLTCLGYQVQHTVLQAGAFGVPQSRQRVIIWGARAGFTLPEFPQPYVPEKFDVGGEPGTNLILVKPLSMDGVPSPGIESTGTERPLLMKESRLRI